MSNHQSPESVLTHMSFINRENQRRHHRYDEEMRQYELMKLGDPAAIPESVRMLSSDLLGHLSDDPIRNMKYLYVASITLVTRFAIEGGLDAETAYNSSDIYIKRMDGCRTVQEVMALHKDMFTYFTGLMARLDKSGVASKPVALCLDEIDLHLHETIQLRDLAQKVSLNPQYLSALFHKETGVTLSAYILRRRLEAAQNMLKYSDFTYAQIAAFLAFSTQSYFIRQFKRELGMTPREYRQRYFRLSFNDQQA